ncbi:MAG: hypothetical protein J5I65_11145 [Aridibacter famidurans]|nr:hypothetical protein [Aridibacter famidurans]
MLESLLKGLGLIGLLILTGIVVLAIRAAYELLWLGRSVRPDEEGFKYVYVNLDGSVREVSPAEREYLLAEFEGFDSGRPYIKTFYESLTPRGFRSGFIERRKVWPGIPIQPVHPDYDARVAQGPHDTYGEERAAGDRFLVYRDGPFQVVETEPDPNLTHQERLDRMKAYALREQLRLEARAKPEDHTQSD